VTAEPGCLQFDVVRSRTQPNRITLYEVYADAAAFELHKKMPHVAAFFAAAKGMIANQSFHDFDRVYAASETD
jgi:quinol monooxygenase YgiN